MCGISARYSPKGDNVVDLVLGDLAKLAYRGYDSWGFATPKDVFKRIGNIEDRRDTYTLSNICIGHTRWSTNGKVALKNTHPILSQYKRFAVVHNGIIENYQEIKDILLSHNVKFTSEMDSEIIPQFLDKVAGHCSDVKELLASNFIHKIKGNNSFVVMDRVFDGQLFAFRHEMPLYVNKSFTHFASDPIVFDEDYALIPPDMVCTFYNLKEENLHWFAKANVEQEKEGGKMLSEIYQQANLKFKLPSWYKAVLGEEVVIYGCGSSLNAGLMIKKFLDENGIRCTVVHSLEVKELNLNLYRKATFIALSQSGETKDTLEATKFLKLNNIHPKCITNNDYNSLAIICGNNWNLGCGPENGVAATKTFWQTVNLFFGMVYDREFEVFDHELKELDVTTKYWANKIKDYNHILILSSPDNYPIALEGALKIKEVANIHAEALFSAEVKHGPLSLIDDKVLSIFLVDEDNQEILNNIEQVRSRGGKVLVIGKSNIEKINADIKIFLPESILHDFVGNLIALQFLSYHLAVAKQLNPDRPRNLCKAVTV